MRIRKDFVFESPLPDSRGHLHRMAGREQSKTAWVFAMKEDATFALGGAWRHWRSSDNRHQVDTFAIITAEPNELVLEKSSHDRMPLIVKRSDWRRWLQPCSEEQPPTICSVRSMLS
jgi:putative SOS response-associated peptidase YedK